ncbi:MAG: cell division protein FtsZ [Treponema sp.]|jgi:cell division protein FtsZ|nr:cell division protein FtsZ [Treponema sp.]
MNIYAVREEEPAVRSVPVEEPVSAIIKVVGTGGGGSNAVNHMIESNLSGVQFIAVNTDVQDLNNKSKAETKLQIGSKLTGGRGAGGKPQIGEDAANEDREAIAEMLRDTDMVFVTAGMGGGTGTGSAPVIAKIARDQGALTVAVVTKPFDYEGRYKMKLAEEGIKKLREAVDTLIVIPNQHLFRMVERSTSFDDARQMADDVLHQGVQGISDLITKTGTINIDFADVESIMKGQGDALMGIGCSEGENRAKDAAAAAIDNPLLEDTAIDGATRILVNIAGPQNIALVEVDAVMNTIKAKADHDAEIICGVRSDPDIGDKIRVTVIATGFHNSSARKAGQENTGENPKPGDGDFINYSEFERMRERIKQPGYLPHRNYQDDLDIPAVIRHQSYGPEPAERKAADGRDA